MDAALSVDALRALPALAPFLVRPTPTPGLRPAVPTGLAPLDALLGGGFPRGRISEIVGPRSSGRTSLFLATLAQATAQGALAALVDVTGGLDPASARALGVELERLLWIQCGGRLLTALRAADVIVRGGGFEVIVVDWGDLSPTALARAPAAAFVRLQRAVEATPTALLFVGARRVAGSLAAVAVALERGRADWARGGSGLLLGLTTEARLVRARERAPGAGARLVWRIEPSPARDRRAPDA